MNSAEEQTPMLGTHIHDQEDWDELEEEYCDCPNCSKQVMLYWSPKREDYLLIGFGCGHCGIPYTDLFQHAYVH